MLRQECAETKRPLKNGSSKLAKGTQVTPKKASEKSACVFVLYVYTRTPFFADTVNTKANTFTQVRVDRTVLQTYYKWFRGELI